MNVMLRLRAVVVSIVLAIGAKADVAAVSNEAPSRYRGYSWPVAAGCTQRPRTYTGFENNVRTRRDGLKRPHLGIDVIPPADDLQIYVAKNGVVVASSPARGNGWGNYVIIKHDDGLSTVYAHLVAPSDFHVGSTVAKGDIVGIAGQTETYYVHSHFEVHLKESSDDWTRGRLDPISVVGPLDDCRNSAAPEIR